MALSDTRRMLRIMSLTTAASMIEQYQGGGADSEDLELTEEEFEMFIEENKKTAEKLFAMAEKLEK